MRFIIQISFILNFALPAGADEETQITWASTLEEAHPCIVESEPNFRRAISCYEPIMSLCISASVAEYKPCLENSVRELRGLLPSYNSHSLAEKISAQYDPLHCHEFENDSNLPDTEFILQCEFTALATQVTAGHIASIWGEIPD